MSGLMNKAKEAMSGHSSGSTPAAGGQKDDYGDKGLAAAEKKMGMSQSRETNEKVTDGARGLYEKQTGSKVSDKQLDKDSDVDPATFEGSTTPAIDLVQQ